MLNINPSRRISATDALKHPWICVSYLTTKKETISHDLSDFSNHRFCIYLVRQENSFSFDMRM